MLLKPTLETLRFDISSFGLSTNEVVSIFQYIVEQLLDMKALKFESIVTAVSWLLALNGLQVGCLKSTLLPTKIGRRWQRLL